MIYSELEKQVGNRLICQLNAIDVSDEATKRAFQENLDCLVRVKKTYDPHNVFRHNHNIDPQE